MFMVSFSASMNPMRIILGYILFSLTIISCSRETMTEPVDDGIPPSAPAGINIYYSADGEVGIEWTKNSEPGIKYYNVYKAVNDSTNLVYIDHTSDDYFFESNLCYDSTYYYTVTSVDIFERESVYSKFVKTIPENKYNPLPPGRVTINALNWFDTLSVNLSWYPPVDTDVIGYYVYRDTENIFDDEMSDPVAFINSNIFKDSTNLEILTKYYYTIVAVDKGGLLSNPSLVVSDIIHDRPVIINPQDKAVLTNLHTISLKSISLPSDYKIVIQRNRLFDIVYQKRFSISKIKTNIDISVEWNSYEPYKTYYWRIITYSANNDEPNSFTDLYSFTIVP